MSKANHNQNQFQKYGIDHLKFQSNFSCFKHFKKHRARTIFYGNSNDLTTIIHANNTPKTCHIFFANEKALPWMRPLFAFVYEMCVAMDTPFVRMFL